MVKFDKRPHEAVYVRDMELNTNWLLNQIIGGGKTEFQITKISNEQLLKFLKILDDGNLIMPDGQNALLWIKGRLEKRYNDAQTKRGENWAKITERYCYILQQLDMFIMNSNLQKQSNFQTQAHQEPVLQKLEHDLIPTFKPLEEISKISKDEKKV